MEYGDSSGTDDDNPQPLYTRVGGRVAVNGRPYQRMQINMESEIHNLEQIAYGAILRAFKAQSDALTWEKEGLITELRKELRVSDDEHRELLTEVNADDLIRRIREWRDAGGNRNIAPNVNNQLQSPTVSASRKRQKAPLSGNPFGTQSQPLHPQSVAGTTLPSAKWPPTSGIGGRRPNAGQPAKPVHYQITDRVSSGAPMGDPSDSMQNSLIGRRVMIRWPADNNFYEAVITEYNPVDGRHSMVYDSNTPNETLEWVNIKEVPPEDIRWVGDGPVISRMDDTSAPNSGRGRTSSMNQFANERPSRNGVMKDDSEEIEILHTETLIKKVEKVLDATHPNVAELENAKKMLKEHEQTLIEVIQRLVDACDSDEEHPSTREHLGGPQRNVSHEHEDVGRSNSYELARG
ncbi:hypothetical protein ABFS82_11G004400 [Erythranthe guttata]|uniref:protein EMSY-LIKE 1-like n=1 Tax=Erythranthe guttata TaxID=4155 RepID=UPI00064D77ED|nr:PREDICTED: protein EMSY-LIKE 1-like [Erythranthe guttata]|eukprot:XP_012857377.1 PREDICTED: protein EMSY-LIKE 1-like [Erythranthe guttata]